MSQALLSCAPVFAILALLAGCRASNPSPVDVAAISDPARPSTARVAGTITPAVAPTATLAPQDSDNPAGRDRAGDYPEDALEPDPYAGAKRTWRIAPFVWFAGLDGSIDVDGTGGEAGGSFQDVFKDGQAGGMVIAQTRKEPWGWEFDATYIALKNDTQTGGEAKMSMGLLEADLAWRPLPESPLLLLAGLRGVYYDASVDEPTESEQSGDLTALDPVIGVRGDWNFAQRWWLDLRGDVAGFGLGTDYSWQLRAIAGYRFTDAVGVSAGWRSFGTETESDGVAVDARFDGFLVGMFFEF